MVLTTNSQFQRWLKFLIICLLFCFVWWLYLRPRFKIAADNSYWTSGPNLIKVADWTPPQLNPIIGWQHNTDQRVVACDDSVNPSGLMKPLWQAAADQSPPVSYQWQVRRIDSQAEEAISPWQTIDQYSHFGLSEAGYYDLDIRAIDNVGNITEWQNGNCSLWIDKTVPVSFINLNPQPITTTTITIPYQIFDQGAPQKEISLYYRYQRNNTDWSGDFVFYQTLESRNSDGYFEFEVNFEDGYYQFFTKATDLADNIEPWLTETAILPSYEVAISAPATPQLTFWEERLELLTQPGNQRGHNALDFAGELIEEQFSRAAENWEVGSWHFTTGREVELVGLDNGVSPQNQRMWKLTGQLATDEQEPDRADFGYTFSGGQPALRNISISYQLISNQPTLNINDVGLVIYRQGQPLVEINDEQLSISPIDGWYRTGWQTVYLPAVWSESWAYYDELEFYLKHDLATGLEVYAYIDAINISENYINPRTEIKITTPNDSQSLLGYRYTHNGVITERRYQNQQLSLNLTQTPDNNLFEYWLETEYEQSGKASQVWLEVSTTTPPAPKVRLVSRDYLSDDTTDYSYLGVDLLYLEIEGQELNSHPQPMLMRSLVTTEYDWQRDCHYFCEGTLFYPYRWPLVTARSQLGAAKLSQFSTTALFENRRIDNNQYRYLFLSWFDLSLNTDWTASGLVLDILNQQTKHLPSNSEEPLWIKTY